MYVNVRSHVRNSIVDKIFCRDKKIQFWMNNGVRLKRENHNIKTLVASLVGLVLSIPAARDLDIH